MLGCGVLLDWGLLLGMSIPCTETLPPHCVAGAAAWGQPVLEQRRGLVFPWAQKGRAGVTGVLLMGCISEPPRGAGDRFRR